MEGHVLAGTPRSIGLVIDDAHRLEQDYAFVQTASGEPLWLPVTDERDTLIPWAVREVSW
jgi:hypothetical protein